MAILVDANTTRRAYTPRLSTPGPVNVPRWDDDEPSFGLPDLSQFVTAGKWEQAPQTQPASTSLQELGLSLSPLKNSLSLGSLRSNDVSEWDTAYRPQAKYTAMKVDRAGLDKAMKAAGKWGKGTGSGFGLDAYGWKGSSGGAGTKGKSPYGFQTPMWAALTQANTAMKAAGLGTFGITDGWRSYDLQVKTKAKKGNLAATPGRSVHGIGLAADLRINKKQFDWLKKNGARFGLMNLPSESWHWQLDPSVWKGGQ